MFKLLLFIGMFCLLTAASPKNHPFRDEVISKLPNDLKHLSVKQQTTTLKKKFSKYVLPKKDHNAIYLHYFSEGNDVTIGVSQGHYSYLYMEVPSRLVPEYKNLFAKVYTSLSDEQKRKLEHSNETGHEGGRTISIDLPQESLQLIFHNNESKDLKSVLMWPIGKEHP